jgi:regulatory protein YycI of two-component signal transduction system YycFG
MKTVNLIRTLVIGLVLAGATGVYSYAAEPVKSSSDQLQKLINSKITYPEKAVRNCCTGSAYVIFSVDEDGTIKIDKIIADNAHIEQMVKDQMANINCKDLKVASFEHYKIKITFKLIG